ncbi:hypothetical protein IPA_09720 [Ignicoccus pacificus DSM 13166]|uniref:Uncharacterized protein n=1 Tax=Ignicoccus pacificus DSM 13166 TaxID=940294 RepID=A0A977PLX2_9CREN|nr:hypothetical protein IPA_09720 [Ignicoccus pacificus DSM 13166]
MNPRLLYKIRRRLNELGLSELLRFAYSVNCTSESDCILKLLERRLGYSPKLYLGIDPGKVYGVALVAAEYPIYLWEGPKEDATSIVNSILNEFAVEAIIIGNGAPSEMIELPQNVKVYVVPEDNTSKTKLKGFGRHASSAYLIATTKRFSKERALLSL